MPLVTPAFLLWRSSAYILSLYLIISNTIPFPSFSPSSYLVLCARGFPLLFNGPHHFTVVCGQEIRSPMPASCTPSTDQDGSLETKTLFVLPGAHVALARVGSLAFSVGGFLSCSERVAVATLLPLGAAGGCRLTGCRAFPLWPHGASAHPPHARGPCPLPVPPWDQLGLREK